MDDLLQSYEEAHYPGGAFHQTHPDSLATPAWLAGITPPPVESCRVLEVGSGTSTNLLAMALTLPGARFVGVDLSPSQIAAGKEVADELRLTNVELVAGDILQMGASLGRFDYIICHGVYSWCPPAVQEAILSLCRDQLTPGGVAYISYNVLPGWRRLGVWRDLARWGARAGEGWRGKVREGRRYVEMVARAAAPIDAQYAKTVGLGVQKMAEMDDPYFLHEYLESFNEPLLFSEMAARVEAKGLQYLGEAGLRLNRGGLPPSALAWLEENKPDRIGLHQALDFFRNTSFRRSLFCSGDLEIRPAEPSRVTALFASALCTPVSDTVDVRSNKPESFRAEEGQLTTPRPVTKAVLLALCAAFPRALSFAELLAEVAQLLGSEVSEEAVGATLLSGYGSNLLELHLHRPRFAALAGERPVASPLARLQARHSSDVTNLRHRLVELKPRQQALIQRLDGTHTREMLSAQLGCGISVVDEELSTLASTALLVE